MTAIIYANFAAQIDNLKDVATSEVEGMQDEGQRKWRIPDGWSGDPLDIEAIQAPFDRTDINTDYSLFFSDGSKVADSMAAKKQADYLSAQERAFRLRHATGTRCTMHAAARRNGHAVTGTGVFDRVANHVQDVIVSGSAGD